MSTDTSTTETATVEPDPAVTNETTIADTDTAETTETGAGGDSKVVEDQDDDAGDGDGPGREAAKYRRRLREAETERDRLSERIESLQRAEIERLATAAGLRPAALWASGPELADLVADDGTVDASKVSAAIGATREQLGIPAPPVGPRVPKEGRSPGRPAKPSGREAMIATVMGRDTLDG
ncbi:hypothetical protein EI067_00375 [Mycobacterium paragordonae]|uniref:hypothetical protein n=1 Tax=Mycobacterium paragordonae TaxID=1389713 RepID=UPI00105FEA25|nr:hypothetical protein [Mycobacterium paragordonae]TDL01542.1 hypothetical protein EI067_00375 [Mycobacterium paragordonae]